MDEITKKAWEVFRSAFKDGEQVVVERADGVFFWGHLTADEDGVMLTRPGGWSKFILWNQVEFMSHDGFPVGRLMGMSAGEAADRARRSPRTIIDEFLDDALPGGRLQNPLYLGGGCPWVAGPVFGVDVQNRGNASRAFDGRDDGEVIILTAQDGAQLHNYDSEHLFLDF